MGLYFPDGIPPKLAKKMTVPIHDSVYSFEPSPPDSSEAVEWRPKCLSLGGSLNWISIFTARNAMGKGFKKAEVEIAHVTRSIHV